MVTWPYQIVNSVFWNCAKKVMSPQSSIVPVTFETIQVNANVFWRMVRGAFSLTCELRPTREGEPRLAHRSRHGRPLSSVVPAPTFAHACMAVLGFGMRAKCKIAPSDWQSPGSSVVLVPRVALRLLRRQGGRRRSPRTSTDSPGKGAFDGMSRGQASTQVNMERSVHAKRNIKRQTWRSPDCSTTL